MRTTYQARVWKGERTDDPDERWPERDVEISWDGYSVKVGAKPLPGEHRMVTVTVLDPTP